MSILQKINGHDDLTALDDRQRTQLCGEIREFLISNVSKTGGHLAGNLGVVELSVAIETVFNTEIDRLVFDVGHQSYVHKLLTGRQADFPHLRQYGGLSGFPKPSESNTDAFVAGHASSSVSIALGMARARTLLHQDYNVVALIGDGACTGGMAYEQFFCDDITAYVGGLAPVLRFPGEEEMRSLAEGALRVLHGQAQPLAY